MGAVWLGRDEVLGRQVALKRIGLLPGADKADLARAEREARLSARLNHPHVVSVFDFVADDDSDARWLVMEYVDGTTLAQVIRSGRRTPLPRRRGPAAPAGGRRTRRRARGRHPAPGREAVQHPRRPDLAAEAHRLRHRPDRGGRLPHPDRSAHRVAGVPRSRGRHRRPGRPVRATCGRSAPRCSTCCRGVRRTTSATTSWAPSTASSTRTLPGCPTPARWRRSSRRPWSRTRPSDGRWRQVRDFLSAPPEQDQDATQVISAVPPPVPAVPRRPATATEPQASPDGALLAGVGVLVVLLLAGVLVRRPQQRRRHPQGRHREPAGRSSRPRPDRRGQADRRRDGVLHPRLLSRGLRGSRHLLEDAHAGVPEGERWPRHLPPLLGQRHRRPRARHLRQPGQPLGQLPGPLRQLQERPRPDRARPELRGRRATRSPGSAPRASCRRVELPAGHGPSGSGSRV